MFPKEFTDYLDELHTSGLISEDLADRLYFCGPISDAQYDQILVLVAAEDFPADFRDFLINYRLFIKDTVVTVVQSGLTPEEEDQRELEDLEDAETPAEIYLRIRSSFSQNTN